MPELVYNVKFNIEQPSGSGGVSQISEQVEILENSLNEASAASVRLGEATESGSKKSTKSINQTTDAINRQNRSKKDSLVTQKNLNNQMSIGNQTLFSLSDLTQDATQFSYGFATGMRAIGNNIGFTAELAGVYAQKIREANGGTLTFNATMQSLKASLFGVGGIILLINGLVTAVTMYTRSLENAEGGQKDVEKSSEMLTRVFKDQERTLIDLAKALGIAYNEDVPEIQERYSRVNTELSSTNKLIDGINSREDNRRRLGEEINRLGRLSIGATGVRLELINKELEGLRKQQAQETRLSEENLRKLSIYKSYRNEKAQELADLNKEERLTRDVAEAQSDVQGVIISQIIKEFQEKENVRFQIERSLELEERVNKSIRERGEEARRQRQEAREYEIERLSRFLNIPQMPVDSKEEQQQEQRNIAAALKRQDLIMQLEAFQAKSNIRSLEDFENAYQKELDILNYQLNGQILSLEAYNLKKAQLDKQYADTSINIEQQRADMIRGINHNLASSTLSILSSAFQNSKAIAIAETVVSTYFAAQQAYASTLAAAALNPLTAAFAPALAKKAAISAVLQGAARVAAIAATEVGSSSVSSVGGGGGSYSLRTASGFRGETGFNVSGEGPSYTPTMFGPKSFIPQATINLNVDETGFALYLQGIEGKLANDTMAIQSV